MRDALLSSEWLAWLLSRAAAYLPSAHTQRELAKLALILSIIVVFEIAARKNWRIRYGSRNFCIDAAYYIFYYSGIYHYLIFTWLYAALISLTSNVAPWLQLNLLVGLPPALQILAVVVVFDFVGYWSHRLRHSSRLLWAFHTVHHSQTKLTPMANYRIHFVDETVLRLCAFIPFQILGPGIAIWLWVDLAMAWILLVQHSEWSWTYGRLGRLVVSPAFHRQHHSTDVRLQNRNFAMLFSFWDDLFGTAERRLPPPAEHGLAGQPIAETLRGQVWQPFVDAARALRREEPMAAPRSGQSGAE